MATERDAALIPVYVRRGHVKALYAEYDDFIAAAAIVQKLRASDEFTWAFIPDEYAPKANDMQRPESAAECPDRELESVSDAATAKQQRAIWIRRCPALFAQREELREAVLACIGDAEGKEAVAQRKMLTLTKGQVQLLAAALDHVRDVFEVRDGD